MLALRAIKQRNFILSCKDMLIWSTCNYLPFQKGITYQPIIGTSRETSLLRCSPAITLQHRTFWAWLNSIFNSVDRSRIEEVGPDRACAEWLLRCGAKVRWKNTDAWTIDYNSLPRTGTKLFKIKEIDATDSGITYHGFPHFENCNEIEKIILHRTSFIDDLAISHLSYLKGSLKHLQISSNASVSPKGLLEVKNLTNLEYLLLYDFPLVEDKDSVTRDLQKELPNCTIKFPYSLAKDSPS